MEGSTAGGGIRAAPVSVRTGAPSPRLLSHQARRSRLPQIHVVIRQESYVAGTRERPEVGIFTQTHASRPPVPWGKRGVGDLVWMKWSAGPIVAQAHVQRHGAVRYE